MASYSIIKALEEIKAPRERYDRWSNMCGPFDKLRLESKFNPSDELKYMDNDIPSKIKYMPPYVGDVDSSSRNLYYKLLMEDLFKNPQMYPDVIQISFSPSFSTDLDSMIKILRSLLKLRAVNIYYIQDKPLEELTTKQIDSLISSAPRANCWLFATLSVSGIADVIDYPQVQSLKLEFYPTNHIIRDVDLARLAKSAKNNYTLLNFEPRTMIRSENPYLRMPNVEDAFSMIWTAVARNQQRVLEEEHLINRQQSLVFKRALERYPFP